QRAQLQIVDRATVVEEMPWRVDVRAGVRTECESRQIRSGALGDLGMRLDPNLGIAGIHHAAVRDGNRDIKDPCHGGILSDLSCMRKFALLAVVAVSACHRQVEVASAPAPAPAPARPTVAKGITSVDQLVAAMLD